MQKLASLFLATAIVFTSTVSPVYAHAEETPSYVTKTSQTKVDPMSDGAIIVKSFLRKEMKFNDAVIAGIVANMIAESNIRTDAIGDGGTSYGLCQWHAGRYTRLSDYAKEKGKKINDIELQLNFFKDELINHFPDLYKELKKVKNNVDGAFTAAYLMCMYYEMPEDTESKANDRGYNAKREYQVIGNKLNSKELKTLTEQYMQTMQNKSPVVFAYPEDYDVYKTPIVRPATTQPTILPVVTKTNKPIKQEPEKTDEKDTDKPEETEEPATDTLETEKITEETAPDISKDRDPDEIEGTVIVDKEEPETSGEVEVEKIEDKEHTAEQEIELQQYYTVTFCSIFGYVLDSQSVLAGQSAHAPEPEVLAGKAFVGWDKSFDNVHENMYIGPVYEDIGNEPVQPIPVDTDNDEEQEHTVPESIYYTVTFCSIYGYVLDSQSVIAGGTAHAPEPEVLENMICVGWNESLTEISGDMYVTPVYVPIIPETIPSEDVPSQEKDPEQTEEEVKYHTVTFCSVYGYVLDSQAVKEGESAHAPEPELLEGMVFTGWDKAFDNVTEDMFVGPIYEPYVPEQPVVTEPEEETEETTEPEQQEDTEPAEETEETQESEQQTETEPVEETGEIQGSEQQTETEPTVETEEPLIPEQQETAETDEDTEITQGSEQQEETVSEIIADEHEAETDMTGHEAGQNPVEETTEETVTEKQNVYTVTFYSVRNEIINVQAVNEGFPAIPPEPEDIEGYTFLMWNVDISAVYCDLAVYPIYVPVNTTLISQNTSAQPAANNTEAGTAQKSISETPAPAMTQGETGSANIINEPMPAQIPEQASVLPQQVAEQPANAAVNIESNISVPTEEPAIS